MTGEEVIASTRDPEGREVVLDTEGWDHIVGQHREMESHQGAILEAVAKPEYRRADPRPGRERFYARGSGPSTWLLVVVDFDVKPARVVTGFGNRKDPVGWVP